jgi:hypothetical protein
VEARKCYQGNLPNSISWILSHELYLEPSNKHCDPRSNREGHPLCASNVFHIYSDGMVLHLIELYWMWWSSFLPNDQNEEGNEPPWLIHLSSDFFLWYCDLNPGHCVCQIGTLPLEPYPSLFRCFREVAWPVNLYIYHCVKSAFCYCNNYWR